MATNKYQTLDEAICAVIRAGRGHPTNSSALEEVARPLIDRRMQAMRKAGLLEYGKPAEKGGPRWRVVDS